MAKIDKDLVAALNTAKTKTMHYALVESADGEGTLIVSKNPVPQSAIAEAQRDLGGGKIFKGQCATDRFVPPIPTRGTVERNARDGTNRKKRHGSIRGIKKAVKRPMCPNFARFLGTS